MFFGMPGLSVCTVLYLVTYSSNTGAYAGSFVACFLRSLSWMAPKPVRIPGTYPWRYWYSSSTGTIETCLGVLVSREFKFVGSSLVLILPDTRKRKAKAQGNRSHMHASADCKSERPPRCMGVGERDRGGGGHGRPVCVLSSFAGEFVISAEK